MSERSSIRRLTKKRGAGGEGARGVPPGAYVYLGGPTYVRKPVASIGSKPRERFAETLPMSDPQRDVLTLLTGEPQRPGTLARALNRSAHGVTASLYSLADCGLAERVPGVGWRRA